MEYKQRMKLLNGFYLHVSYGMEVTLGVELLKLWMTPVGCIKDERLIEVLLTGPTLPLRCKAMKKQTGGICTLFMIL